MPTLSSFVYELNSIVKGTPERIYLRFQRSPKFQQMTAHKFMITLRR